MRDFLSKMLCMPQTDVTTTFATAFVGMNPDNSDSGDNYITRMSSETTLQIPFGVVVVQGTNDDQCKNVSAQSDIPLGVVVYGAYQINLELSKVADSNGNLGMLANTAIRIKRRGRLWVQIDENVATGNAVKYRSANASAGVGPGTFRKSAVGSNTVDISKFAKWCGTFLAATGYGLLEYDFTMQANKTSD